MPYIPKDRIKQKQTPYFHKYDECKKFYGSSIWRNLRSRWLRDHPFCYLCEKEGRTTLATDIHHIQPFTRGATEYEQWQLFTDEDNLVSLCDHHHHEVHKGTVKLD